MKRYYFKLSGTTVVARYIYDTTTAPTGLTEVTDAQFRSAFDATRVYSLSGGTFTTTGDRPYVFDGAETPPASGGRDDFIVR